MEIVRGKNISRAFDERTALRDVNFKVRSEEVFGLRGPPGAGNTALIIILTGQRTATEEQTFVLWKKSERIWLACLISSSLIVLFLLARVYKKEGLEP